jgi:uncharacterized damage-inducible protein DinB
VTDAMTDSLLRFYDQWPQYNRRLRDVVAGLSAEQLAIRPAPDAWPIWATVGHDAGTRVYWLCHVLGEPGAETTPFAADALEGWEDDLDHPRTAAELVEALDSTWRLLEGCLDRWTLDDLARQVRRVSYSGHQETHTLGAVLQRMLTHDAYHCGELSQTLGIAGLPQIDLWATEEALRSQSA